MKTDIGIKLPLALALTGLLLLLIYAVLIATNFFMEFSVLRDILQGGGGGPDDPADMANWLFFRFVLHLAGSTALFLSLALIAGAVIVTAFRLKQVVRSLEVKSDA